MAFSSDGSVLAASWREGIELWDVATNRVLMAPTQMGGNSQDKVIAITPDKRGTAVGTDPGHFRFFGTLRKKTGSLTTTSAAERSPN